MVPDVGLVALVIAFFFSVYAVLASIYGGFKGRSAWVESARNASLVVFPLLSSPSWRSCIPVRPGFIPGVRLRCGQSAMSTFPAVTALWGGQQGSMLFWAWIMSGFVMLVLMRKWEQDAS
jgi:cytochrome c-type biogenesis protein CcmF